MRKGSVPLRSRASRLCCVKKHRAIYAHNVCSLAKAAYTTTMSIDGSTPGSWPDSPPKPNTNTEPQDETLCPVGLEGDGFGSQVLTEDTQKPNKGKCSWKKHKIAMLPAEIIERSVVTRRHQLECEVADRVAFAGSFISLTRSHLHRWCLSVMPGMRSRKTPIYTPIICQDARPTL